MKDYLALKTLFNDNESRTTENLSQFYSDSERLKAILCELLRESGSDLSYLAGSRVLIKPNWVRHDLAPQDDVCLTTHPNFILAVLDIVLEHKPSEVLVADAPIQGCEWDKLLSRNFYDQTEDRTRSTGIPISIIDWRRKIYNNLTAKVIADQRALDKYVLFDLKARSFLEPITTKEKRFRVTCYDPDRLAETHALGKHVYCIAKELFEVDHIIALPKAKTHQKTGITNAIKLLVGINGDKDFLPHHRVGGASTGGDCYPGGNVILRMSEYFLDLANKRIGSPVSWPLQLISKLLWKSVPKSKEHTIAAGWHGNDTTWRMVLDINMIAKFGLKDGTLSDIPQRSVLYICDGIVGGQGDGPLKPTPLPLGVIMWGRNPLEMDSALARLMQFSPEKLPLILNGRKMFEVRDKIVIDGSISEWDEIEKISIATNASPGWENHLSES